MVSIRHILVLLILFLLSSGVNQSIAINIGAVPDLNCRIGGIYLNKDSCIYYGERNSVFDREIILPYEHNKIKIVATADTREKYSTLVEFSTFLMNYDTEWTAWSNLREVSYSNLRDGTYTFKVKARIADLVISDEVSFEFTVKRPFYRTIFAYILYVLVFLGFGYCIFYCVRNRFQNEKSKIQEILLEKTKVFEETKKQLERQQESLNSTLKDLAVLSESGQTIIKSGSMKEISQYTYTELKKFFEIDDIGVGVYNAVHTSIDFPSFVLKGEIMPFARYNLENMSNLIVWSFLNRKSVVISDYKNQVGNYIDTEKFKLDTTLFGSAVYVPLYDNNMTIGVFTVHSLKKDYFTPYHLSIIHNIATYLEFSIVNINYIKKNNYHKKQIEERNYKLQQTYNNLKESQKELQALNSELQRLSLAVRSTDNSVMIIDENQDISWVNNGFTKVYGYTLEEYIREGAYYKTAIKNPNSIVYYDKVFRDGKSVTFTLLHYNKWGKELWIQSTLTPILNDNGEVNQVVVVDTDISVVKKAEIEIMKQRNEIIQKNKEVTKSIEYASVIQNALMTSKSSLSLAFKNSFIVIIPKAIVSGDFFWMGRKFGRKYLAVCDCAGHGVPGAFVSLLGKMFLDEILQSAKVEDTPGKLIRQLNDKLHESVSNLSSKVGGIDGMDLSFVIINSTNTILKYAGAYRPLYIVRDQFLTKLLPDRCSVGNIPPDSDFVFETHTFNLKVGDFLLMCSDGYADQFGYENGKKLGRNNFQKLILEGSTLSTDQMSEFFIAKHQEWKGTLEQVDDISMVGIVISEDDEEDVTFDDDAD